MPPKRRAEAEAKAITPSKRARNTPAAGLVTAQSQGSPSKSLRSARSSNALAAPTTAESSTSTPKSRAKTSSTSNITKSALNQSGDKESVTNDTTTLARKKKAEVIAEKQDDTDQDIRLPTKPTETPVKRKSKAEKEAEAMPLKPRTPNLRMFLGAHVSGAGGVQNSVTNAVHIGGNAFALFLKSQRKWENPSLKDEHRDGFHKLCHEHNYAAGKYVLPHGSYLVNLAQAEKEKADQAYNCFLDDMKRCEALGINLYNFHPGNTGAHLRSDSISRIAQQLNKAIKATSKVVPVLETMAAGGNAIGSTFEDIRDIIAQIDDKTRIGVCIDTCHIFAAGYDLRTPEAFKSTVDKFDAIIGLKYLRAFHMNDSKAPFNSHRDLHQNIGVGFLGLRAFYNIMNESRFEDIPMVLETPTEVKDEKGKSTEDKNIWANEIKLLESLIGMDTSSQEFLNLEKTLAERGAAERGKLQEQVDKKKEKDKKKASKARTKKEKTDENSELSNASE